MKATMKTKKKYYILYKVVKDEDENIIDCSYITYFNNYEDIRKDLKTTNNEIKKVIYKNINNLEKVNTLKNKYFIIKEGI